jgi:hypothetical protein
MKAAFIHGGGWIIRETVARPKARFFFVLSVIWCLVCVVPAMH